MSGRQQEALTSTGPPPLTLEPTAWMRPNRKAPLSGTRTVSLSRLAAALAADVGLLAAFPLAIPAGSFPCVAFRTDTQRAHSQGRRSATRLWGM